MGKEIERKFLVAGDGWREGAKGTRLRQGYLCQGPPVAARVRVAGEKAWLNIKKATVDIVRDEFEYEIPVEDAEHILSHLCQGFPIEKTRYEVDYGGLTWEIDVFEGFNEGLIVAEVELEAEDQHVEFPPWLGPEVSSEPRYFNSCLTQHPYRDWKEK